MKEAVAAVFVHQDQLFMIRRQEYLRAFPGYYAFPGGKVDPGDGDQRHDHALVDPFPAHQIQALFREVKEELGFDLYQSMKAGSVERISRFGVAVTPPFERYRFNAHYFKIVMRERPRFLPDSQEIVWCGWESPKALWQRYQQGEGLMVVPTMHTLRALAEDITSETTTPFNLEYDPQRELPYLELIKGVGCIPIPSNTLPPAETTNALLIGGEGAPLYLVDPSPKSVDLLHQLLHTLKAHSLDGILISHHHPDHHERAPELARRLDLPLLCSENTARRLVAGHGEEYLQGVKVRLVDEGDEITRWQGRVVRCYLLPGHDDGMLGLAPDGMAWFFVSDLVQQQGSVVIPEPEGDMGAYFDSLERVITMQPRVTIPSHGIASGGVHLLQQTLAHRKDRERQISLLISEGLDEETMLARVYGSLDPGLRPLARQNIRQHLRKLGS